MLYTIVVPRYDTSMHAARSTNVSLSQEASLHCSPHMDPSSYYLPPSPPRIIRPHHPYAASSSLSSCAHALPFSIIMGDDRGLVLYAIPAGTDSIIERICK